jgi:broad specificity phosphatase PhoE
MITLIRHAESTFNTHGDKSPDCPLSSRGRRQASRIQGMYDVVVCSPLKRARQTLEASKIQYGEVIFSDLCRELMDRNPINWYPHEKRSLESKRQIRERVSTFRDLIKTLSKRYSRIAVISHSGFLKELVGKDFGNADQKTYDL